MRHLEHARKHAAKEHFHILFKGAVKDIFVRYSKSSTDLGDVFLVD